MSDNTNSVIIYTDNGCWFQQTIGGLKRSSYLGNIGTADEVREFCEGKRIGFADKFHAFSGTALREKWPELAARTRITHD